MNTSDSIASRMPLMEDWRLRSLHPFTSSITSGFEILHSQSFIYQLHLHCNSICSLSSLLMKTGKMTSMSILCSDTSLTLLETSLHELSLHDPYVVILDIPPEYLLISNIFIFLHLGPLPQVGCLFYPFQLARFSL